MGRTVPSFRILINEEIIRWRDFRSNLSNEERKVFDDMMNSSKAHASASSCALQINVFQTLCISIILDHQNRLENIATIVEELHFGERNEEI